METNIQRLGNSLLSTRVSCSIYNASANKANIKNKTLISNWCLICKGPVVMTLLCIYNFCACNYLHAETNAATVA